MTARRGGDCFEQNLLLAQALGALGARVESVLARVRVGGAPGEPRPRAHLLLRVHDGDAAWHADVGFGVSSPITPIPFGPGGPYEIGGWHYRVVDEGEELVLQEQDDGVWADLYGFVPEPVPHVDIETSDWFTATHSRSPFVTGLNVARLLDDGSWLQLSEASTPGDRNSRGCPLRPPRAPAAAREPLASATIASTVAAPERIVQAASASRFRAACEPIRGSRRPDCLQSRAPPPGATRAGSPQPRSCRRSTATVDSQ